MILYLQVKPGCKKDEIVRGADGALKIKIRAQAVNGKANKYLVEYLAEILHLPKSKISIKKGETSRLKAIEIIAHEEYIAELLSKF